MARFEKLQDLFGLLGRTRESQPLTALCDQLSASPATVKRLIAFLREQRGIDIRFDREQGGYRLERGPEDLRTAELLGLSGRELSALLEAEAEKGGRTSPDSEGFFAKVKEFWDGLGR